MAADSLKRPLIAGDRVRVTRPTKNGEALPNAVVMRLHGRYGIIKYDDDPTDDPGFPELLRDLEKIA